MSGGHFCRDPFVLDAPGDDDDMAEFLGGITDELSSGLGSLTIVSSIDEGWLGVGGILACFPQPQSAPVWVRAPTARSFSSALLVASSMMEPPTLWTSLPAGGAGGDLRGGGVSCLWK